MLLALFATPGLQAQCLDTEDTHACERWIASLRHPTLNQLQRACSFEAPFACGRYAQMTRDRAQSTRALIIACRADSDACRRLAERIDDATLDASHRDAARRASEAGCRRWSSACYRLGRQHLGSGRPADGRRALDRGCRGGDARACTELAWRLERGDGLPMDRRAAARIGDRACRAGDTRLCLHRLRQRQAAEDWSGVRRACRRGDGLSCAARDARQCRRGDDAACARAATPPVGACRQTETVCREGVFQVPGQRCATVSSCDTAVYLQRRTLTRQLRKAAARCGDQSIAFEVEYARSGDPFRARVRPPNPCIDAVLSALQVPAAASPTRARGRVQVRDGRPRVGVMIEARRGAPHPPSPLRVPRPGGRRR